MITQREIILKLGVTHGYLQSHVDVRTLKAELTSQLSSVHQAKMGAEYRSTKIKFNNHCSAGTGYAPVILQPEDNTIHNSFQSLDPFSLKQVMENGDTTWTGNSFDGRNPVEFSFTSR